MNPLTLSPTWIIAVAVVFLGLASWITLDTARLKTAKAENANLTAQVGVAKSANDSNRATIAAQGAALDTWMQSATKQLDDAKAQVAALQQAQAAHAKTVAALAALEAKDKALPACTKLLAIDLGQVCPSHAQALKERSQ